MMTPGPDHPITTAANPNRVRVKASDHVIADTADALTLREAGYGPVQYIPKDDIETGFLSQSAKVTQCPYKGAATHYSMLIGGELIENVAWSYDDPYPAVEDIRGRIAFYPDKVEVYEVSDADLKEHHHPG
ncbi:MAG: hypothetical protein B7Y99_10605 [Caulobacterales bacterium 32-69-10]|nr:MAG: hypothetical protein B7Y99_10605 [Caulobacterales bacterium 32-69-10]